MKAHQEISNLDKNPTSKLAHIPGDYGLPLFGYTFDFLKDIKELSQRQTARYGPIYRSSVLFQKGISLMGPEANEFVLKDSERNFSSKLAWDYVLEELFPRGLMLRDFDNHKYHRKIMQSAFKKPAMQAYVDRMQPAIVAGLQQWPAKGRIKFYDNIKDLTLNIAAEVFLGMEMGKEAKKVNQAFVDTVAASLAVLRVPLPGTLWARGLKGRRFLEHFIRELIPEKRRSHGDDFFSQLCHAVDENGSRFSDEDIVDHMIFLMMAAHDTTTSALSTIVFALAKHPEWQIRLCDEYKSIGADTLSYDALGQLEQTGLVFKEALRMYPPLPSIPRRAVRDCEFKGYKIPKNASVNISPIYTHYMPEYWSNPETFDPDRFSKERAEDKRHFYMWIPFGGGAHKCIGLYFAEMQSKLFLFHFLQRYSVSVKRHYNVPYQLVPIAKPKDGLPVKLARRK